MINLNYQKDIEKLKQAFHNGAFHHLTLYHFFNEDYYKILKKQSSMLKFQKDRDLLSHSCSLSEFRLNSFLADQLEGFVSKIITTKIKILNSKIYSFSKEDYTIINDKNLERPGIDILVDFTSSWSKEWGGNISYVDGTGAALILPSQENTLTIVQRKAGINRFVKYVNHHAQKQRKFVLIQIL